MFRPTTRSQHNSKGIKRGKGTKRSNDMRPTDFFCLAGNEEGGKKTFDQNARVFHATPIARFCPLLSHSFTCRPPFRVGLPLWLSVLPLGCCVLYGRFGAVKPPSAATARTELCESGSVSTLVTTGLTPPAVPEERGGYSVRSRGIELPTVGALARSP